MKTTLIKPVSEKKGGVLVFFALSLVVLTGMAALALDVSHLYGVKSQLQVAADAAALAGANALTGTDATAMKNSAVAEAKAVGNANVADVDPKTSQPVAVSLHTADIICGIWDGTTFKADNTTAMNAVEVKANRQGAIGSDQPIVQNWLSNVLSILPGNLNFSQTGVSATAIACRTKLKLVPVAVNEYVGNSYPNSYMRATNVDGSPGLATGTPASAFAFFGGGANKNCGTGYGNTNGFVCLFRCNQVDGKGNWYSVNPNGTGTCSDALTLMGTPKNGDIQPQKGTYRDYLNSGIPDGMVPPNAVREPYNPSYSTCNNTAELNAYRAFGSFTSLSAYATIPHFDGGGSEPGVNWKVGDKLLVMVYDGTDAGAAMETVTVVGYGVIQVDSVGPPTWTGHAIPHGIAGQDDPYIIQPSLANKAPACSDFVNTFLHQELLQKFPVAKLVDTNAKDVHYGVAPGHY